MSSRILARATASLLAAAVGPLAGGAAPAVRPAVPPAVPLANVIAVPAPHAPPPAPPAAAAALQPAPAAAAFPFAPGGDDMLYFEGVVPASAAPPPAPAVEQVRPAAGRDTPPASPRRVALPPPAWEVEAEFLGPGRPARFVLLPAPAFAERDDRGRWHVQPALLADEDRQACAAPAGLAAGDFNGDGRPDVFVACDGQQLLFLSGADGRYARRETAFVLRAHAPEVADVDGDGRADVALRDGARPLVLYGRGGGEFALGTPPGRAAGFSASGTR